MTDLLFPQDFNHLSPQPGVKIVADDGTNPGYVYLSDIQGAPPAILSLEGIQVNSLQPGDALIWDGSKFVNQPPDEGEVIDGGNF